MIAKGFFEASGAIYDKPDIENDDDKESFFECGQFLDHIYTYVDDAYPLLQSD